jgi:hypothetical protein
MLVALFSASCGDSASKPQAHANLACPVALDAYCSHATPPCVRALNAGQIVASYCAGIGSSFSSSFSVLPYDGGVCLVTTLNPAQQQLEYLYAPSAQAPEDYALVAVLNEGKTGIDCLGGSTTPLSNTGCIGAMSDQQWGCGEAGVADR